MNANTAINSDMNESSSRTASDVTTAINNSETNSKDVCRVLSQMKDGTAASTPCTHDTHITLCALVK